MRDPLVSFNNSIDSIKSLHALHNHLVGLLPAYDLSEILRAELVLIVSSFDCFVHDVVRKGILDIFNDERDDNNKYNNFCIPISSVKQILNSEDEAERHSLLEISVKKILSKDSYQAPKNIETALQLISVKNIWGLVKDDMGMTKDDIIKQLGIIINRRNKIAHEADSKDHIDTSKNEIEREDIDLILEFIIKLTNSIYSKATIAAV